MFPIRDERKRVVGFGGRVLPSNVSNAKYLNTPATAVYNKSNVLYGIDVAGEARARDRAKGSLVVMEGYTDCLMAWQAGWPLAVATCGTALTEQHVSKLRSWAESGIVLMFDGDTAGQKAAQKATALFLSSELELRLCALPDGLDPCDLVRRDGLDALKGLVEGATDSLELQIQGGTGKA